MEAVEDEPLVLRLWHEYGGVVLLTEIDALRQMIDLLLGGRGEDAVLLAVVRQVQVGSVSGHRWQRMVAHGAEVLSDLH